MRAALGPPGLADLVTIGAVAAWWPVLFGTDPDPASVPRSETAMVLHGLRAADATDGRG